MSRPLATPALPGTRPPPQQPAPGVSAAAFFLTTRPSSSEYRVTGGQSAGPSGPPSTTQFSPLSPISGEDPSQIYPNHSFAESSASDVRTAGVGGDRHTDNLSSPSLRQQYQHQPASPTFVATPSASVFGNYVAATNFDVSPGSEGSYSVETSLFQGSPPSRTHTVTSPDAFDAPDGLDDPKSETHATSNDSFDVQVHSEATFSDSFGVPVHSDGGGGVPESLGELSPVNPFDSVPLTVPDGLGAGMEAIKDSTRSSSGSDNHAIYTRISNSANTGQHAGHNSENHDAFLADEGTDVFGQSSRLEGVIADAFTSGGAAPPEQTDGSALVCLNGMNASHSLDPGVQDVQVTNTSNALNHGAGDTSSYGQSPNDDLANSGVPFDSPGDSNPFDSPGDSNPFDSPLGDAQGTDTVPSGNLTDNPFDQVMRVPDVSELTGSNAQDTSSPGAAVGAGAGPEGATRFEGTPMLSTSHQVSSGAGVQSSLVPPNSMDVSVAAFEEGGGFAVCGNAADVIAQDGVFYETSFGDSPSAKSPWTEHTDNTAVPPSQRSETHLTVPSGDVVGPTGLSPGWYFASKSGVLTRPKFSPGHSPNTPGHKQRSRPHHAHAPVTSTPTPAPATGGGAGAGSAHVSRATPLPGTPHVVLSQSVSGAQCAPASGHHLAPHSARTTQVQPSRGTPAAVLVSGSGGLSGGVRGGGAGDSAGLQLWTTVPATSDAGVSASDESFSRHSSNAQLQPSQTHPVRTHTPSLRPPTVQSSGPQQPTSMVVVGPTSTHPPDRSALFSPYRLPQQKGVGRIASPRALYFNTQPASSPSQAPTAVREPAYVLTSSRGARYLHRSVQFEVSVATFGGSARDGRLCVACGVRRVPARHPSRSLNEMLADLFMASCHRAQRQITGVTGTHTHLSGSQASHLPHELNLGITSNGDGTDGPLPVAEVRCVRCSRQYPRVQVSSGSGSTCQPVWASLMGRVCPSELSKRAQTGSASQLCSPLPAGIRAVGSVGVASDVQVGMRDAALRRLLGHVRTRSHLCGRTDGPSGVGANGGDGRGVVGGGGGVVGVSGGGSGGSSPLVSLQEAGGASPPGARIFVSPLPGAMAKSNVSAGAIDNSGSGWGAGDADCVLTFPSEQECLCRCHPCATQREVQQRRMRRRLLQQQQQQQQHQQRQQQPQQQQQGVITQHRFSQQLVKRADDHHNVLARIGSPVAVEVKQHPRLRAVRGGGLFSPLLVASPAVWYNGPGSPPGLVSSPGYNGSDEAVVVDSLGAVAQSSEQVVVDPHTGLVHSPSDVPVKVCSPGLAQTLPERVWLRFTFSMCLRVCGQGPHGITHHHPTAGLAGAVSYEHVAVKQWARALQETVVRLHCAGQATWTRNWCVSQVTPA